MPSFVQVATAVAEAWRDRRVDIVDSAVKIVDQLANLATGGGGTAEINIGAVITTSGARTIRSTAVSVALRSSHRRWCWKRCCATAATTR